MLHFGHRALNNEFEKSPIVTHSQAAYRLSRSLRPFCLVFIIFHSFMYARAHQITVCYNLQLDALI